LHVVLVLHVLHRHRKGGWLLLVLMLPGAGALLYLLLMAWDALLHWARVPSRPTGEGATAQDPERELHQRRASLAVSDNFESLDAGECHDDPLVLLGLARSQFCLEQFQAARTSLDRLIAANPKFRSEAGHLLYARSLEALGEVQDALHEYETLTSYSRVPEAHCRYALLLTSLGRPSEAKVLYQALLHALRRAPRQYARLNHQWIALAEREIAALAA
jgi:hypothetical protein